VTHTYQIYGVASAVLYSPYHARNTHGESKVISKTFGVIGARKLRSFWRTKMPTKKELYEIYKRQGGNKPLEELEQSEWTMLSVIYYLEKAKENTDNE
jgi:hypothetical protein